MPASNNGFVKFDRKMTEWEWYRDVPTKVLFIHCIFRANWKIGCVNGTKIKRGQFVTSLAKLAEETGLTIQQTRTALKHLEANGTFKCFRAGCGAQGHLVQLARDFGYPLEFDDGRKKKYRTLPQRPVKVTNPAVRYLESRGISRAVTERYRITTQRGHDNILVFPFYDGDGVMQFVKYRKTDFVKGRDRNKEWSEKDTMPILFGMDRCEGKDRLVITEGQIDSLSLTEAGIQNAVSVPTGAMGFTWLENVWEWINGFAEVIVFGDCEKGKITLVDTLSRRLPKPVKVVRQEDYLGEKDANDILHKYGTEALRQAVANARIIPVTHIKELADVAAVDLSKLPKINTGIAMLDRVIGGLYYGQVILVTGKRGEGKSTVVSQLAAEALNQGLRVLAYSGELPDYHFRRWLDMQLAGPQNVETSYNQFSDAVYRLPEDVTEQIGEWYRGRAYIYDNNAVDDEDAALLDTVEQAVCRYGINFVCIDNLMTAIDAASTDTQYLKQSHFVRQLKQLAVKHNIAVLLVAHPRKTQGDVSENDAVSGSADITNRVDTVISYVKNGEDAPAGGKLLVLKNRMTGKLALNDNAIAVGYDEKSKRVYSAAGRNDFRYGWEKESVSPLAMEDLPF